MNQTIHPSQTDVGFDLKTILRCCVRKLFACNPCYLLSAALLLYGFYRISIDPGFLRTEIAQLRFDLGSLQLYELLLAGTAVWLARRNAPYDAALLVWLENAFVLVPFILISQAGLIDQRQVWVLCFAAAAIVAVRFGVLKRGIAALNVPRRALGLGVPVLLVNLALPIVYRLLHEHKVGTKPDWGAAYLVNEYAWILLLPAMALLVLLLPRPAASGALPLQRRSLPAGLFALWWAASAVHLYCLGYVYDFDLRPELAAPSICAVLWCAHQRIAHFVPSFPVAFRRLLFVSPFLVSFLAANQPTKEVFLFLAIVNASFYGRQYWHNRDRLAMHLMLLCGAAFVGGLPQDWLSALPGAFTREACAGAGAAFYLILVALVSRDPRVGLLGALAVFGIVLGLAIERLAFPAAAQAGLVFLLLHSLRWEEGSHRGAGALRLISAGLWVIESFASSRVDGAPSIPVAAGSLILIVYCLVRWCTGQWPPRYIIVSAILVLLSAPGSAGAGKVAALPTGVVAVVGSFILFGLGTWAALTRHRWHGPAIVEVAQDDPGELADGNARAPGPESPGS